MIPLGYTAKHIEDNPFWLDVAGVKAIYSVSNCLSEDFADYIQYFKHNDYFFFDSPEAIKNLAKEHEIKLDETTFFYFEMYEKEYFEETLWTNINQVQTNVEKPKDKSFHGFDVVTYSMGDAPECSPLSCNSLAKETQVNEYCLFDTFKEAAQHLEKGFFKDSEPSPYRVLSVYTITLSQFYGAN